jgi:hypothetical protein
VSLRPQRLGHFFFQFQLFISRRQAGWFYNAPIKYIAKFARISAGAAGGHYGG